MLAGALAITLLIQGRPAPSAMCVDLAGKSVAPLARQAKPPKATVLIFYLAHCPISQKMTPEINRIHQEFTPKGVKVYMVHEDLTLSADEVAKEAKDFGLKPPVLIDKWRAQMKMSRVTISPEAVVYDHNMKAKYTGRISNLFYGLGKMRPKATSRDLRDAIAGVLAKKPVASPKTEAVGCILPKF